MTGGDQLSVNLLDVADSPNMIQQWKQTITRKPMPIEYKVREIPTLLTNLDLRLQLTVALDLYLSVPTEYIVRVSSESVFDRY